MAWVERINCPVRMCQPIPASPSKRTDKWVNVSTPRKAMKIRSAIEGRSHCVCDRFLFAETMELMSIAVNLIDRTE